MLYTNEDKHPIVNALKSKGWKIFIVSRNKVSDGITGGVWIDCCDAYNTEHYESHKKIHNLYLGNTLKEAMQEVKSDKFPCNI